MNLYSNGGRQVLVLLVLVGFAACGRSERRESPMFGNVKRDMTAFPTASLTIGIAVIQDPGQPAYGIVTPIPIKALFSQGLSAEAKVGRLRRLPEVGVSITPSNFVPGPVFTDFFHRSISDHVPNIAEYQVEARTIGNGWLYVIDQRGPAKTPLVPTRDVIGAFAVRDGVMQATSYRRNDGYVLFTDDGFPRLHEALMDALMKALLTLNAHQS